MKRYGRSVATAVEHGLVVLGAIIPERRDLLEDAVRQLTSEHFIDRTQAEMFKWLVRYSEVTSGAVLPRHYLDDVLKGQVRPGQDLLFLEMYDLLAERTVADSDFIWSIRQLRELASERATGVALTEAMQILQSGLTIGGVDLKGPEDARAQLQAQFQEIERGLLLQEAPEGDVRQEHTEILADYADRKNALLSGTSQGILFGVSELDHFVGGMQPGELVMVAGSSSSGKSSFAVQAAWHASIEQGKNVVFLTTETLRPQIRRKLISRHSKLPQFELSEGINNRDLKMGTLSVELEEKLKQVVSDLTDNPSYGRLYVAQVPRSATLSSMEQRLYRIQRQFNIDLVVMDYLALLTPERGRSSTHEELALILKNAKLLAVTFDNSRGVPFLSPWQINRSGQEAAERLGQYSMRALADTSEAVNSADLIITIVPPEDNSNRYADLGMQILKNRDGETANGLVVEADYATSSFRSKRAGLGGFTRTPSGETSSVLDSLSFL